MDELKQAIIEFVEANNGDYDPAVDDRTLQAHLFALGVPMQVIVKDMPKALIKLALIPDPALLLKKAKVTLTKELPKAIKGEAVEELVSNVATQYNLPEQVIVKAVRQMDPNAIPPKPRLGAQKRGIISYFKTTTEPTLKGLATYLQTAVPTTPDKALKIARMYYTFANELVQITTEQSKK